MMGRRERGQGQFFYAFNLDKVVPADHLVRQIDGVLDLDWVHKELAPYYSHTGRPWRRERGQGGWADPKGAAVAAPAAWRSERNAPGLIAVSLERLWPPTAFRGVTVGGR